MQITGIKLVRFTFQIDKQGPGAAVCSFRGRQDAANPRRIDRADSASLPNLPNLHTGRRCVQRKKSAPALLRVRRRAVVNQHAVNRSGQRGAVQVGALHWFEGACRLRICQKRRQPLGLNRQALQGLAQTLAQFAGGRQTGQPTGLGGLAGQHAGRAVNAADHVAVNQRLQGRDGALRSDQYLFLFGAGDHHEVTHIRCAQIRAQRRVQRLIGGRDGAQGRQFLVPQRISVHHNDQTRCQQETQCAPAQQACMADQARQSFAQGRDVAYAKAGRQQQR